jgi:HSP20 family molecular chaperone IbpA
MTPRISITRIIDQEEASATILARTEQYLQDIRHRAWGYFEQRGQVVGNDWEDWLRAEREAVWKPHAEMFESSRAIVLRVAAPGFDARSLEVTASPRMVLIQGCEPHQHGGMEVRLRFCEFGQSLFRLFHLPAGIDPKTVSATLDKGILEIVAGIQRQRKPLPEEAADASPERPGAQEVREGVE